MTHLTPTGTLERALERTQPRSLERYLRKYTHNTPDFATYIQQMMRVHQHKKNDVVADSGLDRTYAYQIISGVRFPSRDKMLCLSIAAGCTVDELQRALRLGKQAPLYPRHARDAVILLALHRGISTVSDINEWLEEYDFPILC